MVSPYYFEYNYENEVVFEQLLLNSKGSIMNGLNSNIVKNICMAIPQIQNEQQAIANLLDEKCSKTDDIISDLKK